MGVTYPSNGLEQNLKPEHVAKLLNSVAPALYKQTFVGEPYGTQHDTIGEYKQVSE